MSTGGSSKARLGRMHDVMAGYVERGDVPGIVTLVNEALTKGRGSGLVFCSFLSCNI